jgi:mono/diheme cytochrome c family protein
MKQFLRHALVTIVLLAVVAAIGGYLFTRNGLSAAAKPSALEAAVARRVRLLSMPGDASTRRNPLASQADGWKAGGRTFQDSCAMCHGDAGTGKSAFGRNMFPPVPDMSLKDTQGMADGQIYFAIANGIRYTGMPAWQGELTENEIWQLVSFIRRIPTLTPEDLKSVTSGSTTPPAALPSK